MCVFILSMMMVFYFFLLVCVCSVCVWTRPDRLTRTLKVHFASAKLNVLYTKALFEACVCVCVFKRGREKSTLPSLGEIM